MNADLVNPPYDPELMANLQFPPPILTDDDFKQWRSMLSVDEVERDRGLRALFGQFDLSYEDRTVPTPEGDVILGIVRPQGSENRTLPVLYDIHGGGMILGTRHTTLVPERLQWAADHGLVLITPEYTLAPEARAPRAAMECYSALLYLTGHPEEFMIDPSRIILSGISGGGGLAASVGLLVRDKGGPQLLGQLLNCPQLEDRHQTPSSYQFSAERGAIDSWVRETNIYAWNALLGEGHEEREVSVYESPARAEDLRGLPQTFIDVGGCEVFRDAGIAYASKLYAGGVSTELHVWPGGYHGYETFAAEAPVSIQTREARTKWLARVLATSSSGQE
ncbi:alpha/beta hydrolase [Paenarthrobacter sp. NPDC089322]|uniref:alpha/beta hydrolase n=1 Tax=Paenarthrobacter sp. NPDC089322 TaxID=3155065 RepID=UPI00341C1C78